MLVMPPTPHISFDVEGLTSSMRDDIARLLLEQAGETVQVEVVAGGARGADKNALIAKAQAAGGRDPFYLNDAALAAIAVLAGTLFVLSPEARADIFAKIGNVMKASIQTNVDGQRGPGGQVFRPLTMGYALRKQRKFGFVTPILRATGDLINGLRILITKQ